MSFYFKDEKNLTYGPFETYTKALLAFINGGHHKGDLYEEIDGVLKKIDSAETSHSE